MRVVEGLKAINFFSLIILGIAFLDSFSIMPLFRWICYISILLASVLLYFNLKLNITDYESYREEVLKELIFILLFYMMTIFKFNSLEKFSVLVLPTLIYILSGITLLRILRQQTAPGENKFIRLLTYTYSLFLVGFLGIMGIEDTRTYFPKAIAELWGNLPTQVLEQLDRIYVGIMTILAQPFIFLIPLYKNFLSIKDESVGIPDFGFAEKVEYEAAWSIILNNQIVKLIFWLVLITAFALIIYKLLGKTYITKNRSSSYTEEKQFTIFMDSGGSSIFYSAMEIFRVKTNNDRVRIIYRRVLGLCEKRNVAILPADTTLDIIKKSGCKNAEMFELRDLYLRARYSGNDIKKEEVERAKTVYQIIKKNLV